MHKLKSFPLRLTEFERERARDLAKELGISENRLYAEIIHDGLIIREQMTYMGKLRSMSVTPEEGLDILARAPNVTPDEKDRL